MSDLLLGSHGAPRAPVVGKLHFTAGTHTHLLHWGVFAGALARVDAEDLWAPAHDPQTGLGVALVGRVAFDANVWRQADDLPYQGGKACRLLLREWLGNPGAFAANLNGAFAIIIHDPARQSLHLITDRLGAYPVYRVESCPALRLSSHPDILADWLADEGITSELDIDTLAESLAMGCGVHPHTFHRNIKQLDPASQYTFKLDGDGVHTERTVYWRPTAPDRESRIDSETWVDAIATALRDSTRRRTLSVFGNAGLLLSGGLDSRAILFGAENPGRIRCVTFCDRENAEASTAIQLAEAAGARHHLILRDPEHYAKGAKESVRVSGGMWSIKDAHYQNLLADLQAMGFGVLLTGCFADYLLKGLAFNKEPVTLLGKPTPIQRLGPFSPEYYQPHFSLAPEWRRRIDARYSERVPPSLRIGYGQNPSAVEDLRVRPLSREADAMGRLFMWRTLPWDPVMADREIVDLYAAMPPEMKLDFRVYSRAVARVVGPAGRHVVNNNYGTPLESGVARVVTTHFLMRLEGKLRRFGERLAGRDADMVTRGSWPEFSVYVARSPMIAELWRSPSPFVRDLFFGVLGRDAWATPLTSWGHGDNDLFLRLLTLKLWLEQRGY